MFLLHFLNSASAFIPCSFCCDLFTNNQIIEAWDIFSSSFAWYCVLYYSIRKKCMYEINLTALHYIFFLRHLRIEYILSSHTLALIYPIDTYNNDRTCIKWHTYEMLHEFASKLLFLNWMLLSLRSCQNMTRIHENHLKYSLRLLVDFCFFLHFSVKKRSCLHSFLQTFKGTLALAKATTIILSKKMHVFQCLWLKKMLYYQLWFSPIGADAIKLWKFRIQHINFWHLLIFHNLCPKCHVFYGSIIQEITHKIEIMNIPKGNLLIHRIIIWLLHAKPNGNNIYDNTQKIRIQCAGIMLISYMLRMLQQCWALSHPPQSANFSAKTWAAR